MNNGSGLNKHSVEKKSYKILAKHFFLKLFGARYLFLGGKKAKCSLIIYPGPGYVLNCSALEFIAQGNKQNQSFLIKRTARLFGILLGNGPCKISMEKI